MAEGRTPGFARFGDPLSREGALLMVSTREGQQEAIATWYRTLLRSMGVEPLTPYWESWVQRESEQRLKDVEDRIRLQGVADYLVSLLDAESKNQAEQIAKSITIDGSDFGNLIFNSVQVGYEHTSTFRHYVPPHLDLTADDIRRIKLENPRVNPVPITDPKLIRRLTAMRKERRMLSMHLFEKGDAWHVFAFTMKDIKEKPLGESNHWVHGGHMHYASYLWGREKSKEDVLAGLARPRPRLPRLHIRFRDDGPMHPVARGSSRS